ncbi:MAG: hypothetical protein H7196_03625 [candidate division SR1 bacterium]|nr:hypothetical protein [candidate division SR1 bacterium]
MKNVSTNKIDIVQDEIKGLQNRFKLMSLILVTIVVVNIIVLGFLQYKEYQSKNLVLASDSKLVQLPVIPNINQDYSTSITSFYNNSAVSEIGYQLELKKQSISSKNTTNCFTPEIPPILNGCGFIVRPFATGIPAQGTYLHKIVFNAKMGAEDKLAIDIRDNEKNEIVKSIGQIEGKSAEYSVILPNTLATNEQILVRLWPKKESEITIDEIKIESFNIAKLQETKLTLSVDLVSKYKDSKMQIYIDSDQNGLFDPQIDILWNCVNGFPGVEPTTIDNTGSINLVRNDICVTKNAPASWRTDKKANALPAYHWLAVIALDNKNLDIYPFKVVYGTKEYELK